MTDKETAICLSVARVSTVTAALPTASAALPICLNKSATRWSAALLSVILMAIDRNFGVTIPAWRARR
jgi:hypothetical protein